MKKNLEDDDGFLSIVGADHRSKRSVNCAAKFQVIPNHSACLSRAAEVSKSGVSGPDKTAIVDKHNVYRAGVSPTAVEMAKMYWDAEIAMIAQRYADACKGLVHDGGRQRGIPGRFSLGQNLAVADMDLTWEAVVKLWYDEVKNFILNGTNSLTAVGHYTQVVSANSVLIGCGFALCGTTRNYVCNYGPAGNMDYNNPYISGPSCNNCGNKCSGNLCDCSGKVCENGGILDSNTCTCTCKMASSTYIGDTCQLNCTKHTDNPLVCGKQVFPRHCDLFTNVPEDCPTMCNVCPCAGIENNGTTTCLGTQSSQSRAESGAVILFLTIKIFLIAC
ncbi:cysteine-rich venom protein latisemin-like [Saccostrea echinata]|uniref:cysteine-rich venom protein latisemin-like n=1 Tax=Saccostrea echinata TaxID=191078 RepID=UPI002A81D0A3|nr:cysteine-rich venom protein latisemin-like [Saccostrea echinata]